MNHLDELMKSMFYDFLPNSGPRRFSNLRFVCILSNLFFTETRNGSFSVDAVEDVIAVVSLLLVEAVDDFDDEASNFACASHNSSMMFSVVDLHTPIRPNKISAK